MLLIEILAYNFNIHKGYMYKLIATDIRPNAIEKNNTEM